MNADKPDDLNTSSPVDPPDTPSDDANGTWGSSILGLMKIMGRNKRRLAYFQNRLTQARFLDKPNGRLISAARLQADSLSDQVNALELELLELERLEGGGVLLMPTEETHLRYIWWWLNEPSVRSRLRTDYASFERFTAQWRAWAADKKAQPLSIGLATGDLIGFLVMTRRGRTALIDLLILHPDYRHRGYGPDAVRAAMGIAFGQKKPADLLDVRVDPDHTAAVRCFEKAGFRSLLQGVEVTAVSDGRAGVYELGVYRDAWLRGAHA